MHIEYLKRKIPNIPKLNEVDELDDPMVIAHYSCEYMGFEMNTPIDMDWWIIAGEDIQLPTTNAGILDEFRCFGFAKIFECEMGFFDLLCDVIRYGGYFDKSWEPIPLSKFRETYL